MGKGQKSTNSLFLCANQPGSEEQFLVPAVVYQCEHGHSAVVKLGPGHGRPQAKNIEALTPNYPPKTFPAIKDQFMVCNKWYCM